MLESGRLVGGDSGYAYLGTYEVNGVGVSGTIRVVRHDPNVISIFGPDKGDFVLSFNAIRNGDDFMRKALRRAGSRRTSRAAANCGTPIRAFGARVEIELPFEPRLASAQHVWMILLGDMPLFFS